MSEQTLLTGQEAKQDYAKISPVAPLELLHEIIYKEFRTFIFMDPSIPGAINAELYDTKGKILAHLNGYLRVPGQVVSLEDLAHLPNDVSDREKVKYCAAIIAGVEEALYKESIDTLFVNTHPTIARLMEEMGWQRVGERGGAIDLEKKLLEKGVVLPPILLEK